MHKRIIVVGAGPAGMMAAIRASALGEEVTLIEKNPYPGKKLLLSGKGRCNLTNAGDLNSFIQRFSKNGAFLRDAFRKFFNIDLMQFFQKRGLKVKVERQLRVFPVSDRSSSIVKILTQELIKNKVTFLYKNKIKDIFLEISIGYQIYIYIISRAVTQILFDVGIVDVTIPSAFDEKYELVK